VRTTVEHVEHVELVGFCRLVERDVDAVAPLGVESGPADPGDGEIIVAIARACDLHRAVRLEAGAGIGEQGVGRCGDGEAGRHPCR
jgi:hypothetical protein